MAAVIASLRALDVAVSEEVVDLRRQPLTAVMLLASAWWVKDFVFVAIALWADRRRTGVPWPAVATAVATALSPLLTGPLKVAFDRQRPFAQGLWRGLGPLPGSASMPSGHALTAAAGATALAILVPRARVLAVVLAALIAVSRVYLGVHFAGDVLAGAALGAILGAAVALVMRRALGARLAQSSASRPTRTRRRTRSSSASGSSGSDPLDERRRASSRPVV